MANKQKKIVQDQDIPRILLLVETSHEFGRSLLRGVLEFSRRYGPFSVHVWPGDLNQTGHGIRELDAIGIIARISSPRMEQYLGRCGLPVVGISMSNEILRPGRPCSSFMNICDAPGRIGRKGAEYFLENDFRNYAFIGDPFRSNWSYEREKSFVDAVTEAGYSPYVYSVSQRKRFDWKQENTSLLTWLRSLPKPVGLLAAMDARGRQVIDACLKAGIGVPEEVAVLGIDNDALICELCLPTLSSIRLNSWECGYQAAEAIYQMSRGKRELHSGESIEILPIDVVERRSTSFIHRNDPLIEKAVRFINLNAMSPILVRDVAKHLDVSRRTLELRFKKALGRTVLNEINQARCHRIQTFLSSTDLSIAEIAEYTGFSSDDNLRTFFVKMTGMRMKEFRNANR